MSVCSSEQTRRRAAVNRLRWAVVAAALAAWPAGRLTAQAITVVANPSFRPTGVLLPHLQFTVAVDTTEGGLVLQDVTINPVTFTGTVRIEGVQAGARAPETAGFADSVRFGGDGQVTLLVADGGSRSPIAVEPRGARGAAAGRLSITGRNWPYGRVFVVTIAPADLYEHAWRSVGYGVRDRIHVDDRRAFAFLADTSVAGTVVAIGMGRATRGTLRTDITSVVLSRRFGEEVGRERRTVGTVILVIDPARDEASTARAEVVFGLGATEDEAAQAAQAASVESEASAPAAPRVDTPSGDVDLALAHLFAAARPMLDWDRIEGDRSIPAGSSDLLIARAADGWRGAPIALQLGDAAAVCSSYQLFRRHAYPSGLPRREVAVRLSRRGRYVWSDGASGASVGEEAPAEILMGYACYRASPDSGWLAAEFAGLRRMARRVLEADRDGNGLVESLQSDSATATEDPRVNILVAESLERLAELEDEAVRRSGGQSDGEADGWRTAAERIRAALPVEEPGPGWGALLETAARMIRVQYGRPSDQADANGLAMAAAGGFVDRVARGLFGVDEHLDRVEVAPRLDGIADDFLWRLDGWRLAGDSLGLAYRPADRAATIRVGAPRRVRLVLRFPWLAPTSCVSVRRGTALIEHPSLVPLADGSMYLDLRAHFDPAEVMVTAGPCAIAR